VVFQNVLAVVQALEGKRGNGAVRRLPEVVTPVQRGTGPVLSRSNVVKTKMSGTMTEKEKSTC